MRKVPLGLAYLAGTLQTQGIYVEAYNLNVDSIEQIDFSKFDFVGITCLTPFIDEINRMSRYIKEKNTAAKIVVGGPHPTYRPREVFRELPLISYAIAGEGEYALPELVLNEHRHEHIKGVYYRDRKGQTNGTPNCVVDINTLPYPNQRIFDHGRLEKRNPFRAIMASRGCPFKCRNCQPILNQVQPFRLRTPDAVFEEVKYLQDTYGQDYFGFIDSELPIKKSFLTEFYRLVRKNRLRFSFHCNARSDLLDEEILFIFKTLNISRLAIGIESGVQRVISKVLKKNIDLDQTRDIFEKATNMGIRTHGHFMIGIPGETLDDMRQTLAYAKTLPAASIEFNMLTPWPGTAFWDICVRNNYLTEKNCARYNEKRKCYVTTAHFTNVQVESFYKQIRETLTGMGWVNSSDGSVYFHPELYQEKKFE